jgi:hypothetical protein
MIRNQKPIQFGMTQQDVRQSSLGPAEPGSDL